VPRFLRASHHEARNGRLIAHPVGVSTNAGAIRIGGHRGKLLSANGVRVDLQLGSDRRVWGLGDPTLLN
jgi:hypothetical protein